MAGAPASQNAAAESWARRFSPEPSSPTAAWLERSSPKGRLPERPWVESDTLETYLASVEVSPEARAFCRDLSRDGFAVIDLEPEASALCDRVVAETEPYFADPRVHRVQDAWMRSPAVRQLAVWPRVMAWLELAYGRRPFAFQTLNFKRGTQQPIHCDTVHFHTVPERFMCGVWTALEDVTPASGALEYLVGSHRLPVLTMAEAGADTARYRAEDYPERYVPMLAQRLAAAGLPTRTALLRKGQALVWAANLAHGGSPVADPQATRRSLVTHMFFEDGLYHSPVRSTAKGLDVRLPSNVATGGWVWPRREGRPAAVPVRALLGACARAVLRRPRLHRV